MDHSIWQIELGVTGHDLDIVQLADTQREVDHVTDGTKLLPLCHLSTLEIETQRKDGQNHAKHLRISG